MHNFVISNLVNHIKYFELVNRIKYFKNKKHIFTKTIYFVSVQHVHNNVLYQHDLKTKVDKHKGVTLSRDDHTK